MVTEMLVEPSTTWLLVSTSPDEVMIMPVPAAAPEPLEVWMTVLMSTIAGSTLAAIACALSVPFWFGAGLTGAIGAVEVEGSLVFGSAAFWVACDERRYWDMVKPMPIPPPAARIVATTVPTASQRPNEERGAAAGGRYGCGGANQPSGVGGGGGTISLDCGSISDIGVNSILHSVG